MPARDRQQQLQIRAVAVGFPSKRAVAVTLLVALGAGGGWAAARGNIFEVEPESESERPSTDMDAVRSQLHALRTEVRRSAAASRAQSNSPGRAQTPEARPSESGDDESREDAETDEFAAADPGPDEESIEAMDDANQVVDAALQRGRWTRDDGLRLRDHLLRVSHVESHRAVTHRILHALNSSELSMDADAPPF